jgi:hypothetical protein
VGKVIDRHKVGQHFDLDIGERHFTFRRTARSPPTVKSLRPFRAT